MINLTSSDETPRVLFDVITGRDARTLGAAFAAINPWAGYPYPADAVEAYLGAREPGAPRFAIHIDGALAGAIGIRLNWLRGPYLQFLGILPDFQRRGLGEKSLAWFEGGARAQLERNLWVAASDFNADAIRFYERHGFERAALLEGLVDDSKTELLFRKRLIIQK